jgi:fibro-slime domain-containing protein
VAGEYGAYKLGEAASAGTVSAADAGAGGAGTGCGTVLTGIVRDFREDHPDFGGKFCCQLDTEMVADTLGADQKPVYRHPGATTPMSSGQANFDHWYRTIDGVNLAYLIHLSLEPTDSQKGILSFASSRYFPLDGQGFNTPNSGTNFSFTTELHTQFVYRGGETFTFTGDDDVFVFINGRKAVDLGGVHEATTGTVDLDAQAAVFGIQKGGTYPLDLFNAERHAGASNFRIDTALSFVNCGIIVPDRVL